MVLFATGLLPVLALFGVDLPEAAGLITGVVSGIVIYIAAGAGLYLILNAFMESLHEGPGKASLIVGLIILAVGLIPLLYQFGVIGFSIPVPFIVYQILFLIEGILLIIAAFNMNI